MVLKRQIIALSAFVLVGGISLPLEEAMAFGQQWRPVPGFAPGNGANFGHKGNVPGFRPYSAARPAIARSALRMQRPAYPPRPFSDRRARPFAPRHGHPMAGYNPPPMGAFMPPPGHRVAGYPQPAWTPAFPPMVSPWGEPAPMFTRQFGWRPAQQPWLAQAPRWQHYRARVAPRPARAAYRPAAGSWRPARVSALVPTRHFATRSPAYAAKQRPMFGSGQPGGQALAARPIGATDALPRYYWRPHLAAQPGTRVSGQAFRPRGYGRRQNAGRQLLARADERAGLVNRNGLPGWMTTYEDDAVEGACSWCSGS